MVVLAFVPTLYYILTTKNLVLVHAMTDSVMWGMLILWCSRYFTLRYIEVLALVSTLLLLPRLFGFDSGGILGNASMSGCFNVALASLLPAPIGFGVALASLLAKSSMTFACFAAYALMNLPARTSFIFVSVASGIMYFIDPEFVSTNGRYENWLRTIDVISKFDLQLLITGLGFGSYSVLNPVVQGGTNELFIWAHNDYLQLMYEGGLWAVAVFAFYHFKAFRHYPQYVVITLAAALGNMPYHFNLWLFISGVVLHESLGASKRVY